MNAESDVQSGGVDQEWYGQQKKNDWQTPPRIIDGLNEHLDGIDLDPCAGKYTDHAETNWSIHYGEDGLERSWRGYDTVFVNPPFSEKQTWIQKIEREISNTETIVLLTPASMDVQSWFHNGIANHVKYVCFFEGRVKYVDPETQEQMGSPSFGTMLSLYGDVPTECLSWLTDEGWVVEEVDVA